MSLLPQRKKSAEEIAQLRESLGVPAPPAESAERPAAVPSPPESGPSVPGPVRSLRKSEQVPVLVPAPEESGGNPKIPIHRHSADEIAEIRRREALALMAPHAPNPKLASAHIAILIPGYLLAIAGASCFVFQGFPLAATAGCSALSLVISGFVFVRRPISRHHAGFIAIISLFVIVFGTLHYFPQLRHAT